MKKKISFISAMMWWERRSAWMLCVVVATLFSCSSHKQTTLNEKPQLSYEEMRKYDYYFLEATRMKEKGEYAASMELYEHCLAINPSSAVSMYELAQYYAYLSQPKRARDLLERAVSLEPDNFWYRQTLAAFYRKLKENDKAIAMYEQMVEQFPEKSELLMLLYELYSQEKDYANMVNALDRLELKEGKNEQMSMEKFRLYNQLDDKENAFREIESLLEEFPNDLNYKVLLGDCYLDSEQPEKAFQAYQEVLDKDPEHVMANHSLIYYYSKQGMDSLAQVVQNRLLENPKLESSVRVSLMQNLIAKAENENRDSIYVLQMFDKLLKEKQRDADMAMLCYSYMKHKKMSDEAVRPVLEKILEIEPDNVAARYNLLMIAVRKNDYEDAVKICEMGVQYSPGQLPFYYYLGMSYLNVSREKEALDIFRRGVKLTTQETDRSLVSDFYQMIGDLSYAQNDKIAAYAAYDSALVYKPDNIGVLNNYAYFLSLDRKDLDKAEEMIYKVIKAEPKSSTYLDTYAWVLFEKGRYSEARIYIDEALKNEGERSVDIVEHCGDIYYMCGEVEKAVKYWIQADEMGGSKSNVLRDKILHRKYIKAK
ncbi:MAG: tetratricopeptide repeat protein [Bacteroidaceae bacterium]|nr:tetratricopeptide repeat protein [Bacteroidaceae bacterium]